MAAPPKSKFSLKHGNVTISPKLQAQIDSCPKDVHSFLTQLIAKFISETAKYSEENGRLNVENLELKARLKLCEAGVIEERKTKKELSKMPADELQRTLLERINFDNRLHQEIGAAKAKKTR